MSVTQTRARMEERAPTLWTGTSVTVTEPGTRGRTVLQVSYRPHQQVLYLLVNKLMRLYLIPASPFAPIFQ